MQFPYHEAFSYQFFDGTDSEIIYTDEDAWRERVQRWLDRSATEGLRAWNSAFDFHFAEEAGFTLPPEDKWYDGMLEAHAIDERRSVALKNVANSTLGEGADDLQKQVKGFLNEEAARRRKVAHEEGLELVLPNFSDVPRPLMTEYGLEDVFLTRKVCDQMAPVLARTPDLQGIVDFEREVLAAKFAVEKRGFPVDEHGYRMLEIEIIENLERMSNTLDALAAVGVEEGDEFEFNPKAPKQVLAALKRRGANLEFVTNDSMDKENLDTVDDDLARAILSFRAEFKALSTYVRPYISRSYEASIRSFKESFITPQGRIHANYRQIGTRTGRMSCSDPNIQNQPRDDLRLRYNFKAEPGHKLVTCDLNSIEMAIFAMYAGEGRLLDAVKEGADLHTMTAELIGIRDRARAGGHVESARQRGKTYNFSVVYGGGARTIRKQLGCSQADAKLYRQRYNDVYPEVSRLQARIEWALEDRGFIKSAWGRRFRCNDPRKEAYKFTNYLVQGTAADLLKASLIRLHKEGIPVVALVHDEIIAHVPEGDAEETKQAIIAALTEHPRITERVPLFAEGDIVNRWSDAKPKKDGSLFVPKWDGGS